MDHRNASTDDVTETCGDVTSAILCDDGGGGGQQRNGTISSNATSYVYSDIRPITLAVYLVTFVFGLVGNTLVIYVIAKYRKIRVRSVSNYYIWNLAFADELFVLTLPFVGYATYANNWPFDAVSCKVVKYIFYLESIRPIRTAENFEAVDWATGFSNKNGCIVGLIDTAAG